MPASSRHRLKETAMLATILTVLAVAIAGVLLAAATRPNVFRVRRSAVIAAPPERILPLINDLRQFNTWNPFANKDPAMQMTYHGPESGPGAANDFEGRRAGKGSLTILESAAGTVAMRLLMTAPFACDNTIEFALSPRGAATEVTWTMAGANAFIGKVMSLFCNMDKMVGREFDSGLAALKAQAERNPQPVSV
jgi:hypothetical protein